MVNCRRAAIDFQARYQNEELMAKYDDPVIPSEMDVRHLSSIRMNVNAHLKSWAEKYDRTGCRLLDVAPQDYAGAAKFFVKSDVSTLDLSPEAGATFTAD